MGWLKFLSNESIILYKNRAKLILLMLERAFPE